MFLFVCGYKFELFGLDESVKQYELTLNLIRHRKMDIFNSLTQPQKELILKDAKILYGLMHARFIITKHGLRRMRDKYNNKDFGHCPRNYCSRQPLLPVGLTDRRNKESVRLYCCRCEDVYIPSLSLFHQIDGAYFGTTFAHLFLLEHPGFKPRQSRSGASSTSSGSYLMDHKKYIPKVFGFTLHKTWHQRALQAKNLYKSVIMKHDENEEETKNNAIDKQEFIYLSHLSQKQQDEIIRLKMVIKKQNKEMEEMKAV